MIFLFDEHFSPRLVYILKVLNVKTVHITEVFSRGTKDEQFLPQLTGKDYVLVTCDRHIRTRPPEAAAYKASGIIAIFVGGFFEAMVAWDQAEWLISRWRRIEAYATRMAPGTSIKVNQRGTPRYLFAAGQKRSWAR